MIDRALVLHVASLANLELAEDEIGWYQTQLSKVLGHIEELRAMPDPLGAEWRGDVLGEATAGRPDIMTASIDPELAMATAPKRLGTSFQVPRIIE